MKITFFGLPTWSIISIRQRFPPDWNVVIDSKLAVMLLHASILNFEDMDFPIRFLYFSRIVIARPARFVDFNRVILLTR